MLKRSVFLFLIVFVLYWPIAIVLALIGNAMVWDGGPKSTLDYILYFMMKALTPLPVNLFFIALFSSILFSGLVIICRMVAVAYSRTVRN